MNKEKLLKLIEDKIQAIKEQIEKRKEIIRRTACQGNFIIDPWKFDNHHYRNEVMNKLCSPIGNDKQLEEYRRRLTCLQNYSRFIEEYCIEHNIKYFGIP
jgi:hypothetical protein